MKFLADMDISMATVHALRAAGEEVIHLRDEGLQTMPDEQILRKAIHEERIILTCDLDFGELLAASGGTVPSVVLFRTRNQTPNAITPGYFRCYKCAPPNLRPVRSSSLRMAVSGCAACRYTSVRRRQPLA